MVIGPGGKMIRSIQEKTGTKIDIGEDGTVFIASDDGPSADRAREMIVALVEEPELGRIYTGRVTRVENYGAFVEVLPGHDGLVPHQPAGRSPRRARRKMKSRIGDEIMVMITDIDGDGKIRLSRQAVLEGWTLEEARAADTTIGSGGRSGGGRGGGSRGRGGGDRRGGGGDRRGRWRW